MNEAATMYFTEEESQELLRARNFLRTPKRFRSGSPYDEKFVADLFNPKKASFFGGSQHKTQSQFDSNKCHNTVTFRKPAISSQLDAWLEIDINEAFNLKLEYYNLETIVCQKQLHFTRGRVEEAYINCYFCSEDSPEVKKALFLGSLYEEN